MRKHQYSDAGRDGLSVKVRDGEPIEKALRRLKKKVTNAKVLETLREKQFYTKPSEKRKKAKAAARARWLKYCAKRDARD